MTFEAKTNTERLTGMTYEELNSLLISIGQQINVMSDRLTEIHDALDEINENTTLEEARTVLDTVKRNNLNIKVEMDSLTQMQKAIETEVKRRLSESRELKED